jgi:acyl-CoA thioesterase-2
MSDDADALSENLLETLRLERLEENLFRGFTADKTRDRIYGGQVIAQALLAAYETVEARICHSLHGYFIRPGDPAIPIIFEVDRSRDGGSFTTRRVVAIQHGRQIFNLAASFQAPMEGFEHQAPRPTGPRWDELAENTAAVMEILKDESEATRRWATRARPIEARSADARTYFVGGAKPPQAQVWFRCRSPIGDDPRLHQVILAYASDMNLLSTAMRPHGVHWNTPGLQSASLDHAMWFHRPSKFNDWHLYVQESPSASGGRGFIRALIYDQDGRLAASVAQEGLMRMRDEAPA